MIGIISYMHMQRAIKVVAEKKGVSPRHLEILLSSLEMIENQDGIFLPYTITSEEDDRLRSLPDYKEGSLFAADVSRFMKYWDMDSLAFRFEFSHPNVEKGLVEFHHEYMGNIDLLMSLTNKGLDLSKEARREVQGYLPRNHPLGSITSN
jgi:hypothetical protein